MSLQTDPTNHVFDYLIIGGGPAGLQMGYFLEKAECDYLILEADASPAAFFRKFPRHRTLISSNKVYTGYTDPEVNLRWDWNSLLADKEELLFKNYSSRYFPPADDFVRYLETFSCHYGIKINTNSRVTNIAKSGEFRISTADGNAYTSRRLIVATGVSQPFLPPIPGIDLVDNYVSVSTDPQQFRNQRVLILGKGNSGFETAGNLIESAAVIHVVSPHPLSMAWKTHYVGHLRAVNNNFLDTYQLKSQNAVLDASVERIEKRDGHFIVSLSYTHAGGEHEDLVYDRVIACTGFRFDPSMFAPGCRPALTLNDRFPQLTAEWESTNIKDLYFVGTLMQSRDYKKSTSGFIHGYRYNIRALHRLFEEKFHGRVWPRQSLSLTPEAIVEAVVKRINRSSALWQQFGFLGDLITIGEEGGQAFYYEEIPVDYVNGFHAGLFPRCYIVTLEFGKIEGDPFNVTRSPNPDQAERSTFLHPVVRCFTDRQLTSEHHFLEDLDGVWLKDRVHIEPFRRYMRASFESLQTSSCSDAA